MRSIRAVAAAGLLGSFLAWPAAAQEAAPAAGAPAPAAAQAPAAEAPATAAPAPEATTAAPQASAEAREWQIGTSLIGEPRYGEPFPHFEYVNPSAPKGGTARMEWVGTFDSFNPVAMTGQAAAGLGLIYETLMTPSLDESSTIYGLLAEAISYPDDYSSVSFRLDPNARWHDGQPVTVEDVIWSFEKLKEVNPNQAQYYRHVVGAEKTGEHEVTFTFDEKNNRELPHIVGQILVMPKHWWTAEGADGQPRDIARSTLEIPLGSGPYRIASFNPGRDIVYERVEDYWGADLPVNVGQNNFDTISYTYFRDDTIAFEAFKANQFDWWSENRAARWATGYDFPAVEKGWVIKERFENPYRASGLMVGFFPNLRRPLFQDIRVRQALNLAFDFETMQRTLFFGEYERPDSYFYRSELASSGLPEGEELAILEKVRGEVPESTFTETYENPVGGDNAKIRDNLRRAVQLLKEAGYEQRGGRMVNVETGEPLSFEILMNGPTLESVIGQYQQALRRIGIEVTLRPVDPSQYINRVRSRDYDMIYAGVAQSSSPGNEQYYFWGSQSAEDPGSQNYMGIQNPAVDALIREVVQADDRETLEAATKALDRVLLANHYVIPSYVPVDERIARWDRFSHPEELPEYSIGWPNVWWYDEEKAAKVPAPQ